MTPQIPAQHPDRIALANELHARPFPSLEAPVTAAHLAFRQPDGAENRGPELDRVHLRRLLDFYGAQHPAPEADHYSGQVGRAWLKWERHTEFVTYTLFDEGQPEAPFDGATTRLFPSDWLADAPGEVISAALAQVHRAPKGEFDPDAAAEDMKRHFSPESLAIAFTSGGAAMVATDYRIHADGMARVDIRLTRPMGARRIGRMVQRLLEIETYKSAAMLTLPVARRVSRRVAEMEITLASLTADREADPRSTLDALTDLSAEIEALASETAFRFGAAQAYADIVGQRLEALRQDRVGGRQTLTEFLTRRFAPAMRTCRTAESRLEELALRTGRAASLLRTRVDVELAEQNQKLLTSMDRRAELQTRLQQTVEGLSFVAISYYAVSLALYVLEPLGEAAGLTKGVVTALATPPMVILVWLILRRVRERLTRGEG